MENSLQNGEKTMEELKTMDNEEEKLLDMERGHWRVLSTSVEVFGTLHADDLVTVLICDGCDGEFDLAALDPPLLEAPDGDWFCGACSANVSEQASGSVKPPMEVVTVLICDGCDSEFDMAALDPPLTEVPSGNWQVEAPQAVCIAEVELLTRKLYELVGKSVGVFLQWDKQWAMGRVMAFQATHPAMHHIVHFDDDPVAFSELAIMLEISGPDARNSIPGEFYSKELLEKAIVRETGAGSSKAVSASSIRVDSEGEYPDRTCNSCMLGPEELQEDAIDANGTESNGDLEEELVFSTTYDPKVLHNYECLTCRKVRMLHVLHRLGREDKLDLFKEPVTEAIAPTYFDVIKSPMDLSTMRRNILDGKYARVNFRGFRDDFELMCLNATILRTDKPSSGLPMFQITQSAIDLSTHFKNKKREVATSAPAIYCASCVTCTNCASNHVEGDKDQLATLERTYSYARDTCFRCYDLKEREAQALLQRTRALTQIWTAAARKRKIDAEKCPLCERKWDADHEELMQCDACDCWVHPPCDALLKAEPKRYQKLVNDSNAVYICAACRPKEREHLTGKVLGGDGWRCQLLIDNIQRKRSQCESSWNEARAQLEQIEHWKRLADHTSVYLYVLRLGEECLRNFSFRSLNFQGDWSRLTKQQELDGAGLVLPEWLMRKASRYLRFKRYVRGPRAAARRRERKTHSFYSKQGVGLNTQKDAKSETWVHVNCALWSMEVFEDVSGVLHKVQKAKNRSRLIRCDACGLMGATVGCSILRCAMHYHFPCAVDAGVAFLPNGETCCPLASHLDAVARRLEIEDKFTTGKPSVAPTIIDVVDASNETDNGDGHTVIQSEHVLPVINPRPEPRRSLFSDPPIIVIDVRKKRLDAKRGIKPRPMCYRVGALTVHTLGHVFVGNTSFHTRVAIYPLGFRSSRIFWSTRHLAKRCLYECVISSTEIEERRARQKERGANSREGDDNDSVQQRCRPRAVFKIIPSDDKDRPIVASSAEDALIELRSRVVALYEEHKSFSASPRGGEQGQGSAVVETERNPFLKRSSWFSFALSGDYFFGFGLPEITRYIEELPYAATAAVSRRAIVRKLQQQQQRQGQSPLAASSATTWASASRKRSHDIMELSSAAEVTSALPDVEEDEKPYEFSQVLPSAEEFQTAQRVMEQLVRAEQRARQSSGSARTDGFEGNRLFGVPKKLKAMPRRQALNKEATNEPVAGAANGSGGSGGVAMDLEHLPITMQYRELRRRPFDERLLVRKSSIHGYGLFLKEPVSEGQMIVEYQGHMIGQRVADERERRYEEQGIGSCYMFRLDENTIIDATRCGNLARFINHSCDPKAFARVVSVEGGEKKIVIFAKRAIAVGDEVTYDYKFPIEDEAIRCDCNAPNCIGRMN
ncbi:hypothetical protein BBJ29_006323 [Phytophthora kernoviae]|uniref:Histone-lysine N-methyltransferase n=1 Tax=Phytophthora kernoviae TaxID=325452 RepID=A0A3F2RGE1_9STRA|nr:hypothetical protein BBJ29_006323 [Phytophthora kernoviae]RLN56275.1 hypothetical protein BBP00_00008085 [Phytophthora kernoviae]